MIWRTIVILVLSSLIGGGVIAASGTQPGEQISVNDPRAVGSFVFVTLQNEDTIRGTIVRVSDGVLQLEHEILGDVRVPTNRIVSVTRVDQTQRPGSEPTEPGPVEQAPEVGPPVKPEDVIKEEPKAKWDSRVELGLNGSDGNSERLNGTFAFRTTRVTEGTRLAFDTNWRVNTNRGDRTANRLTLNARHDWDLPDTQWTLFVQGGSELDEFRDFDVRATGGAGFNYRFIEEDDTRLSARIGFGVSRDFGGPDPNTNPELITGFDFSHRLTERQRLAASGELFPDLEETGEFRSVLNARWEYKLDAEQDLSLAIGVEHRYDSQTTNDMRTDIDYFVRLVLGF